jgi:hypothetical protein
MLAKIYYSLPVQLLILNLKRNRLILLLWILLFAIITGKFAKSFGVPYLFLDPEYLTVVDFWSLFILGVSLGIFTMAYNITIYILESYRFQFLMLHRNAFARFSLNNGSFPILLVSIYIWQFINFQTTQGCQDTLEIFKEIVGFLTGFFITLVLTIIYFRITGYAIFRNITQAINDKLRQDKMSRVGVIQKIKMIKRKSYHIDYFLDLPFNIKRVDPFRPYDKLLLSKIVDRNHLNALLLQITGFIFLLLMGLFRDSDYFQIPAAASIMLLISMIVMIMGATAYWLKGWTIYVLIAILFAFNFAIQYKLINPDYQVFGLNYEAKDAEYTFDRIKQLSNEETVKADFAHTINMLNNWKAKFPNDTKPKMIFICTSGGGQRAAVWTLRTLQMADSLMNGTLMKNTFCITGASGGLIGASYYRELYLRKQLGENINPNNSKYLENISKDMLNPIAFTLVINDLFIRYQKFSDGKYTYTKDRGYAFEQQLNENTEGVMDRKIMDYKQYEEKSTIPMLLLTPSVVNDGRKLYVSPQPLSFLNTENLENKDVINSKYIGIEFMRFFKEQDAENLRFLSGLRMSATFPYITPNVNLPSSPTMEIMDAGISDNYGIAEAVRFTYIFRNWINENTGGVIFLCIRDSPKMIPIEKKAKTTIIDRVFNPIGTLYANWDWLQDNTNEYYLEYANSFINTDMKVVEFQYSPTPKGWDKQKKSKKENDEILLNNWKERASLNWHLTKKEKESLKNTIFEDNNSQSLEKLVNAVK